VSDFFEHILSRSFGDTTGVRPRPVVRFEASDVNGASGGEMPDAAETNEDAGAARREATASPRSLPEHADASAARREATASPRSPQEHADASVVRQAKLAPRALTRVVEPAEAPARHVMPIVARPLSTDDSTASSENSSINSSTSAAAASTPLRPSLHEGGRAPAERQTEFSGRAQSPPSGTAAPADSPATPAIHIDAKRAGTPGIFPRVAPALPEMTPFAARESAEATPTNVVRVTIGRIEVTVPPPRPRAAATPRTASAPLKPARSLDDYLRRRDGGGR
jgi:hypothetical protein